MTPRIIFAGAPEFAAIHLQALLDAGVRPVAVYTQPDRPAKRGHKLTPTPVRVLAEAHNLEVHTPATLRNEQEIEVFRSLKPDLCIVVAYGLLLPKAILEIPKRGCINVHASLLPAWRGAAPIQRALLSGAATTGVSVMQLEEELDAGPVFTSAVINIAPDDTTGTLTARLAQTGAQTLTGCLDAVLDGSLTPRPQDISQTSYAGKITKQDACLDFTKDAESLSLLVRAMNPWPVAFCTLQGVTYKVFRAVCIPDLTGGRPGEILCTDKDGISVSCGTGVLRLITIQAPGRGQVSAADLARSKPQIFRQGAVFESGTSE